MVVFFAYLLVTGTALWYTLAVLPLPPDSLVFSMSIVQWAVVSLLSFLVYRQEEHYRGIFFQMWFFFGFLAFTAPIGYTWAYFEPVMGWILAYELLGLILYHALFLWMISKVVFMYIFRDEKRWAVNVLSTCLVVPLTLWLYWPYWWSPELVMITDPVNGIINNFRDLEISSIWINCISLLLLLAFFLHKLKTDRPIGVYADTLLFLFIILAVVESAEYIAHATSMDIWNISQWAFSIVAAAMSVTLTLRLKFKSQTIADYYESQCLSDNPDIDRRVGLFDRIILRTFFDTEKIGEKVFLGVGDAKMRVRRTPSKVPKTHGHAGA